MSEEKWKCPKCGAENAMDDNFCGECGGKKPVVGIGMAQTVKNEETVEKEVVTNEQASEKPKKKGVGKIVLILAAVCVVLIVCGVVINKLAEQQRIGSLYWSKRSRDKMTFNAAVEYCQNLSEGGYSDWRLPTISELRTTIKNCSGSQSGGSCRVSDNCLGSNCWSDSCFCDYKENNGGYYSKLGDDDKVGLWSSSVHSGNPYNRWYVLFLDGLVGRYGVAYNLYVRCVR